MEEKPRNKMGTMPVGRLMLAMGVPMVCSMMLQAVYNIVDSAFVANMAENGEQALNALTLAFPMQMLMVAVAIGTGVGANALLAKCLGLGDREKASRVAGNALFLGVLIYLVFLVFGLVGVGPYIGSQTANPLIRQMGTDYLRICTVASFGIVFFAIYEKLLQAGGQALYSTIAQIAGAVTNIVLDPVLIYGLLGLPALGVRGAALATVIGQVVSFLTAFAFHMKRNPTVDKGLRFCRPSGKLIRSIYAIGLPAIIAQALMSLMTYGLNLILGGLDEAMVTAYGLYYKVQQFLLFAAFGLRDAITPIVAFAHGMGSRKRVMAGVKYGQGYTFLIMLAGLVVLELFAVPFTGLFHLSGQTESLCVAAMHIISISFVFAGANIAFQGIFQALDGGLESLILSLCRQLIFILPVAMLFARLAQTDPALQPLVWVTFPLGEGISFLVGLLLYRRIWKGTIRKLGEG